MRVIRGDYGESGTKSCAEMFPEEDVVEETGRYAVNKKKCVCLWVREFFLWSEIPCYLYSFLSFVTT